MQTQSRIVATLDAICDKHKARDMVACVFHSDPIKLAIAHYIGLPLDQFQRLGCDTASASLLGVWESGAQLMWLNRKPPMLFPAPDGKPK